MNPAVRNLLLLVVGLVAAIAGYYAAHTYYSSSAVGEASVPDKLVEFTLPDLDGHPRNIKEWSGRVVVLNFWATWCPPCREEIPLFIELQQRYGSQGLQFLGVAIDRKDEVAAFRRAVGLNYPTLLGQDTGLDLLARYGNRSGSLPYSVVIGRDGKVLATKLGAYKKAELESLLKGLLTPPSSKPKA